MELNPYHKRVEHLLVQFEEVKILHRGRAVNARDDALAALAAYLSISDGDVHHMTIARRRFLTPLTKMLSQLAPKGICSIGIAIEPIEDWRIRFWTFSNKAVSLTNLPSKLK